MACSAPETIYLTLPNTLNYSALCVTEATIPYIAAVVAILIIPSISTSIKSDKTSLFLIIFKQHLYMFLPFKATERLLEVPPGIIPKFI
mmetsp:Transcript_17299/g.2864  ORF Transcript_17299/g.2864 Transcript_17299/m.2864 type:complete len:89 (-) Transcript_17299:545-811(-)